MPTSFVIQPFDKGPFDKRYAEVFSPAIIDSDLEPYRVDRDPRVAIPIDEIENGIRKSAICLADITLDNPNVWFELGFAISARKNVILVCSTQRPSPFPFDVQHRSIIRYSSDSISDFQNLRNTISARLKAALAKELSLSRVAEPTILADVGGLQQHEILVLAVIAENLQSPGGHVSTFVIASDVEKNGLTQLACVVALRNLSAMGFIEEGRFDDYDGSVFTGYSLTDVGWEWITKNLNQFVIRKVKEFPAADGIPF